MAYYGQFVEEWITLPDGRIIKSIDDQTLFPVFGEDGSPTGTVMYQKVTIPGIGEIVRAVEVLAADLIQ